MKWELILTIVFGVLSVVVGIVSYYFYIRNKLTKAAVAEIDKKEDEDTAGPEKKAQVIAALKSLIPAVARPFIPDKVLDALVQTIFDSIEHYAKKQIEKKSGK